MTSIRLYSVCFGVLCCFLFLIAVPLTAQKSPGAGMIGAWEWKGQGFTISLVLKPDGTGSLDDAGITYQVKNQHLLVTENGEVIDYTFRLSENQLTLSGGDLDEPTSFTRKGGAGKGIGALKEVKAGAKADAKAEADTTVKPGTTPSSSIVGSWTIQTQNGNMTLNLKTDGSGMFNTTPLTWQYSQKILSLSMNGQTVMYNAALSGDSLTLSGGDMQQPATFQRGGGLQAEHASTTLKTGSPIAGSWSIQTQNGVMTLDLKADGSGAFNGTQLTWQYSQKILSLLMNGQTVMYNAALSGDSLTLSGADLQQPATFQRGGSGPSQQAAAPSGATAQVAGVWVGEESSLDPQYYQSYTQYVVLFPDGSVGYDKAEGGATRSTVSEYLERFSSYQTGRQGGGGNFGRWETDGSNIVIQWNHWNNLVSRGQVDVAGGVMNLSGMGVLEGGSTLQFKRQQ